ncbi:MAG: hypothetical protein RQ729_08230 [Wenzhouxiangellaceae bacterium]|nr:hypothetical protein [Wenzhouxiangellaceae bacterium]
MINTLSVGAQGIQSGMQRLDAAAQRIAADPQSANPSSLATPMVEQKLATQQVQASAEVIQTADEMIGSLLDIMA